MSFEVVDREIWFIETESQAFRDRRANHERTGQARSTGGRERVNFSEANSSFDNGVFEQTRRVHKMITGRHFRNDAAELLVLGHLRRDLAREKFAVSDN